MNDELKYLIISTIHLEFVFLSELILVAFKIKKTDY